MDTSRSPEWTATALVFSGRVDPTWSVSVEAVGHLLAIWDELTPAAVAIDPPVLGYRGASLRDPDGTTWLAHGGTVVRDDGLRSETRLDIDRTWEHVLINTAPEGLLPPMA